MSCSSSIESRLDFSLLSGVDAQLSGWALGRGALAQLAGPLSHPADMFCGSLVTTAWACAWQGHLRVQPPAHPGVAGGGDWQLGVCVGRGCAHRAGAGAAHVFPWAALIPCTALLVATGLLDCLAAVDCVSSGSSGAGKAWHPRTADASPLLCSCSCTTSACFRARSQSMCRESRQVMQP